MIILSMYNTMMPLILGGITNMIFTKTSIYNKYKYPVDCYKKLSDGERILGDNKTFIGFISMIIFVTLYQILWGIVCNQFSLNNTNDWYLLNTNNIYTNINIGLITGFMYSICEIPNSYIKRRLHIEPGKTTTGKLGATFLIVDQIDSLIGVFLVLKIISNLSLILYIEYLLVGAVTHLFLNYILHKLRIRKNL